MCFIQTGRLGRNTFVAEAGEGILDGALFFAQGKIDWCALLLLFLKIIIPMGCIGGNNAVAYFLLQ